MWQALAFAAVGAVLYAAGALVLLGEVGDSKAKPTPLHRLGVGCAAAGTTFIFVALFLYPA